MIRRRKGRDFTLTISIKAGDDKTINLNDGLYKVMLMSEFGTLHEMPFEASGNLMTLHFIGADTAKWPWGRYRLTLYHGDSRELDIDNIVELVTRTTLET